MYPFAVAIDSIFNVPGAGSVNEAVTTLTNEILRDSDDLTAMLEQTLNEALSAQAQVQGYSGTLPSLDAIPLDVSYELSTFDTTLLGKMGYTSSFNWNWFLRRGRTWQTDSISNTFPPVTLGVARR